jgi:fused signal recognition particle receptor
MADNEHPKRSFFSRLFGLGKAEEPTVETGPSAETLPAEPAFDETSAPAAPVEPAVGGIAELPVALESLSAENEAPVVSSLPTAGPDQPDAADASGAEIIGDAPTALPVSVPPFAPIAAVEPALKAGFWARLTAGLARTSSSLTTGITDLFTKRKLDATTLEDLEDILIQADLGIESAARIAKAVGQGRYEKGVSPDAVRQILAREVAAILEPVARPLRIESGAARPITILMVGVNGSGKTTTIGKLAARFRADGQTVVLAAGDTFRAAAIEQLKVWGARTGSTVIAREQGADAAGLAFEALTEAKASGADVLLIDTAGRLQNKTGLMDELAKIVRVIKKVDPAAPHAVLLVLDATVGQNALSQVEAFRQIAGVTGLVMTKLDGTARGGILVALSAKFGLPVHLIGVGEGVDDLETFDAQQFARAIVGLEDDR